MTRAALVWGGGAAALLGLGGLAFGIVVATTATPADHVQRYLEALARDDLAAAARLAGLQPPTAMPLGDEGEPGIPRIVSSATGADGVVTVIAEYGADEDAVRVSFRLEPAPPVLGLVPAWAFTSPPVATLTVAADEHDRLVVNERPIVAAAPGDSATVTVFVPARVTVRLDEPLLRAEPETLRVSAEGAPTVVLEVEAGERLERAVGQQVERLLIECAEQRVLQPTGCPFGVEIADRIVEGPEWQLDAPPDLVIEPSDTAGVWQVRGGGAVRLEVSVQSLFDGDVVDREESIGFVVRGQVVLDTDGPVLTIYPPGG